MGQKAEWSYTCRKVSGLIARPWGLHAHVSFRETHKLLLQLHDTQEAPAYSTSVWMSELINHWRCLFGSSNKRWSNFHSPSSCSAAMFHFFVKSVEMGMCCTMGTWLVKLSRLLHFSGCAMRWEGLKILPSIRCVFIAASWTYLYESLC